MTDPNTWTSEIKADSDAEAIAMIQQRLVEWKWLAEDSYTKGSLDGATVDAVIAFQNACVASGLNVTVTDPENVVIGTDTLHLLFNADNMVLTNPNA